MDPFGQETEETGDLSNFQPQADASAYNGDFYEVESSETQPTYDYGAPQESEQDQEQEQSYEIPQQTYEIPQQTYEIPQSYEPEPVASYSPEATTSSFPVIEEDNELTKFMRKYEAEIADKAAEQEKVAVASKDKAKTDMDKFVAERSRLKESKQQANRVQEQATLEKLAADLESENPWERVVTLVDLEANRKAKLAALNAASAKKDGKGNKAQEPEPQAKSAKKKDEDEEDVSRMRQLFVQLKASPLEKTRSH